MVDFCTNDKQTTFLLIIIINYTTIISMLYVRPLLKGFTVVRDMLHVLCFFVELLTEGTGFLFDSSSARSVVDK